MILLGDTGYDEGEFLLPMCEIKLEGEIGDFVRDAYFIKELDVISILRSRLEELKEKIIGELGETIYEELLGKVTIDTDLGCVKKSELSALKEKKDALVREEAELDERYKKILEGEKELRAAHPELFKGKENEEAGPGE